MVPVSFVFLKFSDSLNFLFSLVSFEFGGFLNLCFSPSHCKFHSSNLWYLNIIIWRRKQCLCVHCPWARLVKSQFKTVSGKQVISWGTLKCQHVKVFSLETFGFLERRETSAVLLGSTHLAAAIHVGRTLRSWRLCVQISTNSPSCTPVLYSLLYRAPQTPSSSGVLSYSLFTFILLKNALKSLV